MKGDLSGPVYRGVGLALGSNQHQKQCLSQDLDFFSKKGVIELF